MIKSPNRIFLVRHGLSEANIDKNLNKTMPDHAIPLSDIGHMQATEAGRHISQFLRRVSKNPERIRLLVSPYRRTKETADRIEGHLREENDISKFLTKLDRREAMELREISFGLFDGYRDDFLSEIFPREYEHYEKHKRMEGETFAPMPLGESRVQVGDRVKAMFGTILRDADRAEDPIRNFVVVSHGVTIRQFRHRWMHYNWEWAENEVNPNNCAIDLIEGRSGQGYNDGRLFKGFPHVRDERQKREDGVVG